MKLIALVILVPSLAQASASLPDELIGSYGAKNQCEQSSATETCHPKSQFLKIERTSLTTAHIELEVFPGNGNMCTYEGPASWQGQELVAAQKEQPTDSCVITISFKGASAHVRQSGECYCGSGASLNGLVLRKSISGTKR